MDITVAYFHSLLRPEIVKQDFEQIRAVGASSILCTIYEQEEQRSPRDFVRGLRQAQDAGLKVNLSLGRFGNLFAGSALVPSWYTFHHPQSRVMDQHGRLHDITCFNHQTFRSWLLREVERYLASYPINGILFDEPGGLEVTCYCPACRALCPDVTDLSRFRRRSMIAFLSELCAYVKQVNARVRTTIVLRPQDTNLTEDLVSIEQLDSLGCHLFWNILQERIEKVERWGREIVEMTRQAGKGSQLWLQNFNIDRSNEAELENAFAQILGLEPDELGCYYFWRNNADPVRTWEITRRLLRRVPRRQMHWHTYTRPSHPVVALPSKSDADLGEKTVAMAAILETAEIAPTAAGASAEPLSADNTVTPDMAEAILAELASTVETPSVETAHPAGAPSDEPAKEMEEMPIEAGNSAEKTPTELGKADETRDTEAGSNADEIPEIDES